jgi:hypothetical protein
MANFASSHGDAGNLLRHERLAEARMEIPSIDVRLLRLRGYFKDYADPVGSSQWRCSVQVASGVAD